VEGGLLVGDRNPFEEKGEERSKETKEEIIAVSGKYSNSKPERGKWKWR
jgi:hypothetical protein